MCRWGRGAQRARRLVVGAAVGFAPRRLQAAGRALLVSLLASASALTSASVRAQAADASAEARAHFEAGLSFADEANWERAAHSFQRALALRDAPSIRYNLAQSLAHLGRLVDATTHLDALLVRPDLPAAISDAARQLRQRTVSRVARLTVDVEHARRHGLTFSVDGDMRDGSQFGQALPADPGRRVARLWRGSEELAVRATELEEGASAEVLFPVVVLGVSASEKAVSETPAEQAGGEDLIWLWLLAGGLVAAAAVTVGVVLATQNAGQTPPQPTLGDFAPPFITFD